MRYIFLDIDGVLNTIETHEKYLRNPEDASIVSKHLSGMWLPYEVAMVARLKNLLSMFPETCIIGISSWFNSRRDVKDVGKLLGVEITSKVSYTGGGLHRPLAIEEFLNKNWCDAFVILDDQVEGYEMFEKFHVKTAGCGFTSDKFDEAVEILKRGW